MIEKTLTICSWENCGKIRVSDSQNMWLSRQENEKLYDKYMKQYEGKLSHGFCPEHAEEYRKREGINL